MSHSLLIYFFSIFLSWFPKPFRWRRRRRGALMRFAELSLTVPIVNTLAFLFTVLGDWWVEGKAISRGVYLSADLFRYLSTLVYANPPRYRDWDASFSCWDCAVRAEQSWLSVGLGRVRRSSRHYICKLYNRHRCVIVEIPFYASPFCYAILAAWSLVQLHCQHHPVTSLACSYLQRGSLANRQRSILLSLRG